MLQRGNNRDQDLGSRGRECHDGQTNQKRRDTKVSRHRGCAVYKPVGAPDKEHEACDYEEKIAEHTSTLSIGPAMIHKTAFMVRT
jgi:hypothetical protein